MKVLGWIVGIAAIIFFVDLLGIFPIGDSPPATVPQVTTPATQPKPIIVPTAEPTTPPPETVKPTSTPPPEDVKPEPAPTVPIPPNPNTPDEISENTTGDLDAEVKEIAAWKAESHPDATEFSPETSKSLIHRKYEWEWGNSEWWFDFYIPQEFYNYFRSLDRTQTDDYSVYVTHPLDDQYIQLLVDEFVRLSEENNLDERGTVDLVRAFVQSLPYTVDSVTTSYDEYPRYPVETLVDEGGDCEDTSILLAAFLDTLGYGVVLVNPPGHLGVGVKGSDDMPGVSYEEDGIKYFYIETTGIGWEIGDMPDEYLNESAYLYHLVPTSILTHSWSVIDTEYDPLLDTAILGLAIKVENIGTAPSGQITVLAGFDAGNDQVYNPERYYVDLEAGYFNTITFRLRIPRDVHTRIIVQIAENGILIDESYSKWIDIP
jgi:hypothetical protein